MNSSNIVAAFSHSQIGSKEITDGRVLREIMGDEPTKARIIEVVTKGTQGRSAISSFYWEGFQDKAVYEARFVFRRDDNPHGGHIKLQNYNPCRVQVSYNNDNIVFNVLYTYCFDILVFERSEWSGKYVNVGNSQFNVWSHELEVPAELVALWMMNELEGETNITLESSDELILTYESGSYPLKLFEYFSSSGKDAIEKLRSDVGMNEVTYRMIKSRVAFYQKEGTKQPPQPSSNSSPVLEGKPQVKPPSDLEQLADLAHGDRAKLLKIAATNAPHSIRVWTDILGYKSTGGTEPFIDRMKRGGWLTQEKLQETSWLRLTVKAKRVLGSAALLHG